MAVNERTYIRILPESTGDRVGFYHTFDVEYTNRTRAFVRDEIVIGAGSGTQARVIKDTPDDDIANAGVLSCILEPGYSSKSFTTTEALQVSASTIATAGSNYCIYIGRQTLAGGNNPHNLQHIDEEGQAFVRFAEGAPQFDAFGKMQTSEAVTLGRYLSTYNLQDDDWHTAVVGSATVTHESNHQGTVLSCSPTSGDKATRITHRYHYYQLGKSQLFELTAAIGDQGKTNVDRTWGYGDTKNGAYFHLSGSTLYVRINSYVTGSLVSRDIAQASWNVDTLDGSGDSNNLSGINLDVSKDNIYWIDLQWLGAGRIRFGVVIGGTRIVCHEDLNANQNTRPYMATGQLPVFIEQENTGTAASTSEMRIWCAAVKTEGSFDIFEKQFAAVNSSAITTISDTTWRPIWSGRAKQTLGGLDNRSWSLPKTMDVYVSGGPVVLELVEDATLSNASFAAYSSDSGMEIDESATSATGGTVLMSRIFSTSKEVDLSEIFHITGHLIHRKAIITSTPETYTVRARNLSGSASSFINTALNWVEAH